MQVGKKADLEIWAADNHAGLSTLQRGPFYVVSVQLPTEFPRLVHLLDLVLSPWRNAGVATALYVRDWTIWSETVSIEIFNCIRRANGISAEISDSPVCFFTSSEFGVLNLCLVMSCLGGWDANLLVQDRKVLIVIDHDGFLEVKMPQGAHLPYSTMLARNLADSKFVFRQFSEER